MHSKQQIQLIADSLLPGFLPKDKDQNELHFHFTISKGKTYRVDYERKTVNNKNEWTFMDFAEVNPNL